MFQHARILVYVCAQGNLNMNHYIISKDFDVFASVFYRMLRQYIAPSGQK